MWTVSQVPSLSNYSLRPSSSFALCLSERVGRGLFLLCQFVPLVSEDSACVMAFRPGFAETGPAVCDVEESALRPPRASAAFAAFPLVVIDGPSALGTQLDG